MCEFIINIASTILGGILLTLILFLLNEYVFRKKNFTGEWDVELTTHQTDYKKYQHMKLYYRVHLLQKGNELTGSGEKLKEILSDGKEMTYSEKSTVAINGYYERKYLGKSRIYLSLIEKGAKREYRTFYVLEISNNSKLIGKFSSTAANSKGEVTLIRHNNF